MVSSVVMWLSSRTASAPRGKKAVPTKKTKSAGRVPVHKAHGEPRSRQDAGATNAGEKQRPSYEEGGGGAALAGVLDGGGQASFLSH